MCMDKKYEVKVTRQAMAQMKEIVHYISAELLACLLYTSPSPRDRQKSRMPSSA